MMHVDPDMPINRFDQMSRNLEKANLELNELRKWDARKPEVQAKVIDAIGWGVLATELRTGQRAALELE